MAVNPRPTSHLASERLRLPVVQLALGVDGVTPETSLRIVAAALADDGLPAIPVCDARGYLGMVRESDLAAALAAGANLDDAVAPYVSEAVPPISVMETGAAALRSLVDHNAQALAVVGTQNEVVGIITPSRLFAPPEFRNRPGQVGGMATPFGVYLTSGSARAGAKGWELIAAGGYLFTLFVIGAHASLALVNLRPGGYNLAPYFEGIATIIFLLLLRFSPMAKIHAAEHMAVHAIEREEAITIEVLRRMPRVHPRCGTNLAVAATVFLSLFNMPAPLDQEVKLLIAVFVTAFFYRPLGNFFQYFVTTAPPKEKHLAMGVRAARELLTTYETQYVEPATTGRRILSSGLIQIMAGAILSQLVLLAIYELLRVPNAWRVISGLV